MLYYTILYYTILYYTILYHTGDEGGLEEKGDHEWHGGTPPHEAAGLGRRGGGDTILCMCVYVCIYICIYIYIYIHLTYICHYSMRLHAYIMSWYSIR